MKTARFVQAAVLVAVVVIATSCGSSREYSRSYPPPRPQVGVSLILNPSPSYVVRRSPDGRYFYQLSNGHTYWRGRDNRYYLDRRYVNRNSYQHRQYNQWRRYYR